MFASTQRFLRNSRVAWWHRALFGATVALVPAFANAADKDKDNDRSNRSGQSARRMDAPAQGQTVIRPSNNSAAENKPLNVDNKVTGGMRTAGQDRQTFPRDEIPAMNSHNKINTVQDPKNRLNVPLTQESEKRNGVRIDPKALGKPSDSQVKQPLPLGDKNPIRPLDLKKDQSGRNDKKIVSPDDLKRVDQHELHKSFDGVAKRKIDPKDLRPFHGDAKLDDTKQGNFLELHKAGKYNGIVNGAVAKKLDLGKQFNLKHQGDLTLKLNLAQKVNVHGGWAKSHWAGLVGPGFGVGCSPYIYCGPGYFPSHCIVPVWSPWVEFCWGFHCSPICDPRPWFCRPWVYDACPTWGWWECPVWVELPVVACGSWVDVEPVVVADGLDLQLLAVRFVDPGQPELQQGPRYRVWARNNSSRTIIKDFNVLLMASNSRIPAADLPQAGVRVDAMEPGEIKAFDIRLPFEVTMMGRDRDGQPVPFTQLHAIVDSHREIPEVFEENNGVVIARSDILPVDPVILGTDSVTPLAGSEINIAGEGFGPEPGQILVHVGGIELQAEIEGWYDLGVRVKLPALALASPTDAELILIRGDTAASNPLTVQLTVPVASR